MDMPAYHMSSHIQLVRLIGTRSSHSKRARLLTRLPRRGYPINEVSQQRQFVPCHLEATGLTVEIQRALALLDGRARQTVIVDVVLHQLLLLVGVESRGLITSTTLIELWIHLER
jgi:hypothetical protein